MLPRILAFAILAAPLLVASADQPAPALQDLPLTAKFFGTARKDSVPTSIAVSPNGKLVATGGSPSNQVLDVATGKVLGELPGLDGPAHLPFTADGRHLISATTSTVHLWRLEDLRRSKTVALDNKEIAASPSPRTALR